MGSCSYIIFQPKFTYMIVSSHPDPQGLLSSAWKRVLTSHRPATAQAHKTHFKMYLSVMIFYGLPVNLTAQIVLIFMAFLSRNQLSCKVIRNYLSSLSSLAQFYGLVPPSSFKVFEKFIHQFPLQADPMGIFDIRTLYHISKACDSLPDNLFRAIFLMAFCAFLRLSNIAHHTNRQFSHFKHFLRKDLIFAPPGAHLLTRPQLFTYASNPLH